MRAFIVFVLSLACTALALVFCPPLRESVESVLFKRCEANVVAEEQPEADGAEVSRPQPASDEAVAAAPQAEAQAPEEPAGQEQPGRTSPWVALWSNASRLAAGKLRQARASLSSEESPPSPAQAEGPAAAPPSASPGVTTQVQPQEAHQTQKIVLPPKFAGVRFGMSAVRLSRIYSIAWATEEAGNLTLVHYPLPDQSQTVRFHFMGDSLYAMEDCLTPAKDQSLKELYDDLRAQYANHYANVASSSASSWSDGTVTARIKLHLAHVEISFECPSARK
jgi:hypothetical protein